MTSVVVAFHFEVAGMEVRASALGSELEVERNGLTFTLRIPSSDDEFSYGHDEGPLVFSGIVSDAESKRAVSKTVRILRVLVDLKIPLPTGPLDHVDGLSTARASTRRVLENAVESARELVVDYLEVARVKHGQFWLGRSGIRPELVWHTKIWEASSGAPVESGYHDPLGPVNLRGQFGLDEAAHQAISSAIGHDSPLPLHEILVADAQHLAALDSGTASRETVLFAAIACEIGIRTALSRACSSETIELMDFVVSNPRDLSFAAVALFDKISKAAIGRSMREEDKDLYRRLCKLFEVRNMVAHQGYQPSAPEVRDGVACALSALGWAESLWDK